MQGRRLLGAVVVVTVLTAGCMGMADQAPGEEETTEPTATRSAPSQQRNASMTAEETEREHEGVRANAPPFYASRVVTIEGLLTLERLPIDLETVNGPIQVETGAEDEYRLVANLTGYGFTPQQAREQRARLSLDWDIGQPGAHQLVAHVEQEDQESSGPLSMGGHAKGALTLTVPESLLADLDAESTNGEVAVRDLSAVSLVAGSTNGAIDLDQVTAEDIVASTTNGPIDATVDGTRSVSLESTNGAIDATVEPATSGSIQASTTNAKIDVAVPEDAEHGYAAEASSTNGDVDIRLEQGSTQDEGGGYSGDAASFRTSGFEDRPMRTAVTLTSTNGDIVLRPA